MLFLKFFLLAQVKKYALYITWYRQKTDITKKLGDEVVNLGQKGEEAQ